MRILYFSRGYSPHDYRFLSSLAKTRHEVFYLQLEAPRRQTEDRPVPKNIQQVIWIGGKHGFRWRDLPGLTFDLGRLTKEIQPDLIHAGPIQSCAFIAVLSGFRPILTMSWGYDLVQEAESNSWMRWITAFVLRNSAFFVSDARVTRDKAVSFGMDPEKTVIFPWGIDLKQFSPQSSVESDNHKSLTLFCNRTWEEIYGVDILAKAFVKVAATYPKLNLILLGGGSQGAKIRQILMNGGVLDRVHFGGQVTQADLPRWYHMADLYISPSHVDGSSVSLMEALASGLPCLVSDIPGNKEWIDDGVNGWLFHDGDADDLADKISNALKNAGHLKKSVSPRGRPESKKQTGRRTLVNFLRPTIMSLRAVGEAISSSICSSLSCARLLRGATRNEGVFTLEESC